MWPVRTAIPGRVAAASIAERASLEGLKRHAAILISLEMTGSASPRVSLWVISWLEIAASRWCSSLLAGSDGQHRGQGETDDQGHQECEKACRRRTLRRLSAAARVEEVTLGAAQGRVAGGVGAGPGRGFGGGLQQGAAVEVGRVAGVACPLGCDVVQPGADNPVGVGFG